MRPKSALFFLLLLLSAPLAFSAPTPAPTHTPNMTDPVVGSNAFKEDNALFNYKENKEYRYQTEKAMADQDQINATGDRSTRTHMMSLQQGQARAEQMIEALKNQDLEKAMQKVTVKGNALLDANQGLKAPATVIAGAVALWVGRSIRLFDDQGYSLSTKIEGRARNGEFNFHSPFLNSRLLYNPNDGASIEINRNIASLNTQAEMRYNTQSRVFSTQINQPLSSGFNLSIGAGNAPNETNRTDGRASLNYQLNF